MDEKELDELVDRAYRRLDARVPRSTPRKTEPAKPSPSRAARIGKAIGVVIALAAIVGVVLLVRSGAAHDNRVKQVAQHAVVGQTTENEVLKKLGRPDLGIKSADGGAQIELLYSACLFFFDSVDGTFERAECS